MNLSIYVIRRPRRPWRGHSANRGRHHRHGQPGPAGGGIRQQPVSEHPEGARVLPLHALPRRAELPGPQQQRSVPKVSPQQLGVSSTVFLAAQNHCRYLLPNGGSGPSQTQVQQIMSGMLKFAQCMRSHGVSNWPDPVIDAGGNPEFYLDGKINQNSPQIKSKIHECVHWIPSEAISPGNPIACPGANPGGGPGCGGCSCRGGRDADDVRSQGRVSEAERASSPRSHPPIS